MAWIASDSAVLALARASARGIPRSVWGAIAFLLIGGIAACDTKGPGFTPITGPTVKAPPSSGPADRGLQAAEEARAKETKPTAIVSLATGKTVQTGVESVASAQVTGSGDVTLNFVNADIRAVLQSVLGDILGLNYVIHPKVEGTVTIQTSQPIKRDDVLPMLEEILQANEVAIVQSEGTYRVMPLALAVASGAERVTTSTAGRVQPGLSTTIVPLKYASAGQLLKVIEPFVSAGGKVQADTARNLFIVSGTRPQIQSFIRLVSLFDVDWMAGMSFGLFPLEQGSAGAVAKELAAILEMGPNSPLSGVVRILPIERINAVLVATTQPAYIAKVQSWIDRLDKGWDESQPRVYVYHVQNSRAADLAKVLSGVFQGGTAQAATKLPGQTAPAAELGISVAPTQTAAVIRAPLASTPGSASMGAASAASPASAAPKAEEQVSAPIVTTLPLGGSTADVASPTHIVADEKNNALVIYTKPRQYKMIEAALKKLDVLPLQILIEATVAEVTLTDNLRYGLQWFFKTGKSEFSLSKIATGAINPIFPGFDYVLAAPDARVVLDALSSVTNVNVISAPQLMVLDHQTATLQVGDEVPIAVQQARSTIDPNAPIVNSIELRNTGVILRVTPRVNQNGVAILTVDQEVSEVSRTTTSNIDSPTIQQRRISSVVAVDDGDTVALGGLIRDNRTISKDGLPILSKIPVLGALFGSTNDNASRTELLVLLTPRVIRNRADAQAVTDELRRRLNDLRIPPAPKP